MLSVLLAGPALGDEGLILQSTTSTKNSGLYDHLLPLYQNSGGGTVHVVSVGTGQAIRNAGNCDGDVLLVHAKSAEEKFVEEGKGIARFDLMYNDFVFVGPGSDPANIRSKATVTDVLLAIAKLGAPFVSRGDDSGTHRKELSLWQAAGYEPSGDSGTWYRETGSGMGVTLNIAVSMNAYVVTDRATWLTFKNKFDFEVLFENDPKLLNQYGITLVNPETCPEMNFAAGQHFVDWMLSDQGQSAIGNYRIDGQQLFFPNAIQN